MNHKDPIVSIIVPVYNDAERLNLCLEALKSQSCSSECFEVIVVDNGSKDEVETIVKKYEFNIIKESQPGSYAARNAGIKYSRGEIVGFTDSDCIPSIQWIATAMQYFYNHSNSLILSGKITIIHNDNNNSALALYDQIYHFNQKKFAKNKSFSATANLFCKRTIFERVGLFNSTFYSFGDVEFGQRVQSKGLKIDYDEHLEVSHPQIINYGNLWKRSRRLAGGSRQLRMLKGHGNIYELLYILFSIVGTPYIILTRFFYKDIPNFHQRLLFSWISLFVHLSKCIELTRLLLHQKDSERK